MSSHKSNICLSSSEFHCQNKLQDPPKEQWSVIPQAQRGVNRGRGAIRRHNSTATAPSPAPAPAAVVAAAARPPSPSLVAGAARRASTGTEGNHVNPAEPVADDDDAVEPMEISVEPVRE